MHRNPDEHHLSPTAESKEHAHFGGCHGELMAVDERVTRASPHRRDQNQNIHQVIKIPLYSIA